MDDDFKPGLKGWIKTIIIQDKPDYDYVKAEMAKQDAIEKNKEALRELGEYGGYDFERPVYGNVIKKEGNVIYGRFSKMEQE